jgi:hypothetical protein
MEIKIKESDLIFELTIQSGNATIQEDLAKIRENDAYVPNSEIHKFIDVAKDMNFFNGKSDVDFLKMIYDGYLTQSEQEEFRDEINN